MNVVTLKEAKLRLEQVVAKVLADAEPAIVVTESGEQVVVLPLDEYDSWKETHYLLSNPANAEHLRRSLAEAKTGNVQGGPPGHGLTPAAAGVPSFPAAWSTRNGDLRNGIPAEATSRKTK